MAELVIIFKDGTYKTIENVIDCEIVDTKFDSIVKIKRKDREFPTVVYTDDIKYIEDKTPVQEAEA